VPPATSSDPEDPNIARKISTNRAILTQKEYSCSGAKRIMTTTTVFTHPDFDDHEQVVFASDAASGLRAIIAVHDTTLGPALGGCRIWSYRTEAEAIADALRLSRGMSYKAALAGLPLGGGKSVLWTAPTGPRRRR
jgi:glutamate dehydrogenase/leucine dehydrogenase